MRVAIGNRLNRGLGLLRSFIIYRRPGRQRSLRRLYSEFIRSGDLVFDIGAHLGDRSSAFAALGARVVALEPQPQLQRWLRRLTRHQPEIVCLPLAVGRAPGNAELALSLRNPTVASMDSRWREHLRSTTAGFRHVRWEDSVTVTVTNLDELIRQYGRPSFCKIDVEGFEVEVLAGLSQPLPALSFEFVDGTLGQALRCLEELERLGRHEFNVIAGEQRRFIWSSWQEPESLRQWLDAGAEGIASGDIYARLLT
ncbi:FkbM family methyltransferase [Marinobacter sp. SS13-12]|uniref:FkbM family methyltransferase n=1 Tax=Marinobacter sp. SS13-12 TaxID=3050451 RepID=UPI0025556536|nr:FkbM family methyltransferase [Marinobacter sp. SS13-12]MDK8461971.1 FkbM family methyltransferase [Marinobacter sp. SS13-12]